MNDRLVWIDCEMTGLDIERDALIEIACLVTDAELNLLDDGIDLIIKPPAEALDQMSDVVRDMHTTSGLLDDLPGGVTLAEDSEAVLAYVRQCVAETRKDAACGNPHPGRARCRGAATRSPSTAGSSRGTCPSSTRSCTTGWWTCRRSRSWRGAGTRGCTSPPPPSTAGPARSRTSPRACRSCGITGRRCSSRSPGRIRRRRGRSPRVTG